MISALPVLDAALRGALLATLLLLGVALARVRQAHVVPKIRLALVAGLAVQVGQSTLPATATDTAVTVFYPTEAPQAAVARGPFTFRLAVDASPVLGNGRLIVLSHGQRHLTPLTAAAR